MDTMAAFAMGQANRGKEPKVFDWDKAAQLIKEYGVSEASAGLSGDWEYTGGEILRGGAPLDSEENFCYLSSTWATPEILINGEFIPCYKMASEVPDWDAHTFWPESAKVILEN